MVGRAHRCVECGGSFKPHGIPVFRLTTREIKNLCRAVKQACVETGVTKEPRRAK